MTQPRDDLLRALGADLQRAADESEPLAYEQIEGYVDGTLDDVEREIVETRLADDAGLRAEVDDLRALRASLAAAAGSAVRPTPLVAPFEPRSVDAATAPRRRSRWMVPIGLAAAALIGIAIWRAAQPRPDGPSQARGAGPSSPPAEAPPTAAAPVVTVAIADRDRTIGLTADGRLVGADGMSPDVADRVTAALRGQRLPTSRLGARVASPSGVLMSSDVAADAFRPTAPVATAVLTPRPLLRWTPRRDARGYRVRIVDEQLQTVAESPRLSALTWRPAAPLPTGRVLVWQVEADTPDGPQTTPTPPLPEARFAVLAPPEAARVEAAMRAATSDLAAAVIAAEAGLYDDAAATLERLAQDNPGAAIVAALQRDLAARRHAPRPR